MPNPITPGPDATLALLQYLRLRPELTALIPAAKIVTEIPTNPTYPYILVTLGGGGGIWPALDEPSMQVDTFGGSKALCGQIARMVRACVWAAANDVVPAVVICSGAEEMAPAYIPDTVPTPPLPRYTARYSLLLHP